MTRHSIANRMALSSIKGIINVLIETESKTVIKIATVERSKKKNKNTNHSTLVINKCVM